MLIGALEAGGTKMVCSIGNPQGGVLQRASFPTLTPDVTVPQIVDFIGKFDVKALGIGSFGPLDLNPASPTYGSITKTPKKEWIQYPLMTTLKDALGVPTGIDTDVNAAALADEMDRGTCSSRRRRATPCPTAYARIIGTASKGWPAAPRLKSAGGFPPS